MKVKTNLITGLIFAILSITLLLLIPSQIMVPAFDAGAPSPRVLPTIILVGMLIVSVMLIIKSLVFKKEEIYHFDLSEEKPLLIIVAMICGFAFIMFNFGFLPGVLLFFPALLYYMGERKIITYVITIVIGVLVYFVFTQVFNISLPSIGWPTWLGG